MNNKKYILCLNCGKVQVRTDILDKIDGNLYCFIKMKKPCMECQNKKMVATKDIKRLYKKLENKKNKTEIEKQILLFSR